MHECMNNTHEAIEIESRNNYYILAKQIQTSQTISPLATDYIFWKIFS